MNLPTEYRLLQNYPNPFNPETHIAFDIPENTKVTLAVYDLQGRQIRMLLYGEKSAGHHVMTWDSQDSYGNKVPSGVYIYRLIAGDYVSSNKMILLK